MKGKRTITVKRVKSYNELAEAVNSEKVVIYIEGSLYDEVKSKAKASKTLKGNRTVGGVLLIGGILTGGSLPLLLGGINYAFGKLMPDDLKKYDVVFKDSPRRIELYLKKGQNKYNKELDSVVG